MSAPSNADYPGGLKKYIRDRIKVSPENCWEWQKALDGSGFPKARVDSKYWGVNRLAHVLWIGEIPRGMAVRQECLNRRCCNPAHLILANRGTVAGLDTPPVEELPACIHGHAWPENLRYFTRKDGRTCRVCGECRRVASRASHKRMRQRQNETITNTNTPKVSFP